MHSTPLILAVSLVASVSAIPITPAAPRLQAKAEHYRLEGWSEFMIARLAAGSATASELHPYPSSSSKHSFFRAPASSEYDNDRSGDLVPGSLDSPQILSYSLILEDDNDNQKSLYGKLCNLFHSRGRRGKEVEIQRPKADSDWKSNIGFYRR